MVDWQPPAAAEPSEPQATPAQPRTVVPLAPVWPTASVPVEVVSQDQTLLQTIRDPDNPWLGYIRAALTIAVLAGLGWILLWGDPGVPGCFRRSVGFAVAARGCLEAPLAEPWPERPAA